MPFSLDNFSVKKTLPKTINELCVKIVKRVKFVVLYAGLRLSWVIYSLRLSLVIYCSEAIMGYLLL